MDKFEVKTITYLGDGVYAIFDGFGIELRDNDHRCTTDKIYIEPSVLEALKNFYDQCKKGI